jgi:acetyl-CoA synthetase
MFRTLYDNPERYVKQYWNEVKGNMIYLTGDGARRDENGYYWIIGRIDDVLNVSGHRIGAAEIESAIISHEAVAFVVLKAGYEPTEGLKKELKEQVKKEIGSIATPEDIRFLEKLPKTKSGKIMHRILRAFEKGETIDFTTLENTRG